MSAAHRHPAHEAAVERVRAAIASAGDARVRCLAGYLRRVLEARSQGETLRAIGQREERTGQASAGLEQRAIEALARDPMAGMGAE